MMSRPEYFERISEGAAKRWDQLEKDPELAGPWHQLFKQVQSPRHVLSELLQNADDAGATEASVHIENGVFIFEHNGEDFTEEHFASLCRFGYSNKRALHTIGFRGIGFKSTFSLGDRVELSTPTLSVAFFRHRFTEPVWIDVPLRNDGFTQVRVKIRDHHRQLEVEKNLQEWLKSPVSLLFFRNIRYIKIQDHEVNWVNRPGPVNNTEWVELAGKGEQPFMLAKSALEQFPEEALSEIKEERMFTVGEDIDLPPCQVEIVLGAKGKLFVVLPTGVETKLPFACNAPFIQDPARLKIKDPETSPTNRWLLKRIGKLATSVMLHWLKNDRINLAERSKAYSILPDIDRNDSSLEGVCATIVGEAFDVIHKDKACLLTNEGTLTPTNKSIIIPRQILDVWPADQVSTLIDDANRPVFSLHVSDANRKKLVRWNLIKEITKDRVLSILQSKHLPKPESWERLLNLWAYIAPEITGYTYSERRSDMCIVPAQGKEVLYSASEVVRLGDKKLLQSDEDWQFLETHLIVLNQNWSRFISDKRRRVKESEDELKEKIEAAYAVLRAINLENSSDINKIIEQVVAGFLSQDKLTLSDCVRLSQIAAKLEVTVRANFPYFTRDNCQRSSKDVNIFDEDGTLEYLLPDNWRNSHLLHASYSTFTSCTKEEWLRWVSSGRSGLKTFVPLVQNCSYVLGRQKLESKVRARGYKGTISFHYVTQEFKIEDWDFEDIFWRHWRSLAEDDIKLWGKLGERILAQPETFWSKARSAKALHIATRGGTKPLFYDPLTPEWIMKLRDLYCLPDTHGFYQKPTEMFRRTPETEPFMDVEPFIDAKFDNAPTRELLDLLGVCNTPTGPARILDRLRAISKAETPPIREVEKWYCRLDMIVDNCSTADFLKIKQAFEGEKIILTEGGKWGRATDLFLSSDEEDVPGAAIIRDSVKDLTIWRKIGIPERPTADLAIKWLSELPTGEALPQEDARRVRELLSRHSVRIWNECGHWLNLAGEWTPVKTVSYALTKQSYVPWSYLHEWVKQKTADLRLPVAITQAPPFSEIPTLASNIEERLHLNPFFVGRPEEKPWLKRLGSELCRIILEDDEDTARIRALAADLADTKWKTTRELEIIPYIEGIPAGTPQRAYVVWLDKVLYVDDLSNAKLARQVPDKLGKVFNHPDISAALNYCFGRSPKDVTEYLEENFKLIERKKTETPVPDYTISADESVSKKEHDLQGKRTVAYCPDGPLGPVAEPEEHEKGVNLEEPLEEREIKDKIKGENEKEVTLEEPLEEREIKGKIEGKIKGENEKGVNLEESLEEREIEGKIKGKIKGENEKGVNLEEPLEEREIKDKIKGENEKEVTLEEPLEEREIKGKIKGENEKEVTLEEPLEEREIKDKIKGENEKGVNLEEPLEEREIKSKIEDKIKGKIKGDKQEADFNIKPEATLGIEVTTSRERNIPKPAKPSIFERFAQKLGYKKPNIIERFAQSQGYKKVGENRFYHADGSWIIKVNESIFPWEKRSASWDLIHSYWPKDHCLQREPLQLEADVWGLIDKFPDTYALVLSNFEGEPVEIPGRHLRTMRDKGEITLYPATYRIVYKYGQQ